MNLFYLYCQLVNANPAQGCSGLHKAGLFDACPYGFTEKHWSAAYRTARAMACPDTLNMDGISVEGLRHDVDSIRFVRRDRATALRAFDTGHIIIVLLSHYTVQTTAVLMDALCPCCPSRGEATPRLFPWGVCPHSPFLRVIPVCFPFYAFFDTAKKKNAGGKMKNFIIVLFIILSIPSICFAEKKWIGCEFSIHTLTRRAYSLEDKDILISLGLKKYTNKDNTKKLENTDTGSKLENAAFKLYNDILSSNTKTQDINTYEKYKKETFKLFGENKSREEALAYVTQRIKEQYGNGYFIGIDVIFKYDEFPILYEVYIYSGKNPLDMHFELRDMDFCTKEGIVEAVSKTIESLLHEYTERDRALKG